MTDGDTVDIATADLRRLGVRLTPQAREHITAYLGAVSGYAPTLGLLYGNKHAADTVGSWSLIAYADENVDELIDFYSQFGASVCFDLDGIAVVIPQIGQAKQLDSGVLEVRDSRLWHAGDE